MEFLIQHLNIDERVPLTSNSSDHSVAIWTAQRRCRRLSDNLPVSGENNTDANY